MTALLVTRIGVFPPEGLAGQGYSVCGGDYDSDVIIAADAKDDDNADGCGGGYFVVIHQSICEILSPLI